MKILPLTAGVIFIHALMNIVCGQQQAAMIKTKEFSMYKERIEQGNYTAKALSDSELVSDYQSPANQFKSPEISFKFSINGKDNEMPSGTDHHFTCIAKDGSCETPVIKFGTQYKNSVRAADNPYLAPNTKLTIRVDLSDVFDAFAKQGFYTTFNGAKLYKGDFKGVYVAGSSSPLIWDFDNLVNHPQSQLADEDGDHIYETTLLLNAPQDKKTTAAHWQLTKDVSEFPQYKSAYPISDALYNMSLEEMQKAIEPDSTFRTGKEWAGVWTRDISYSIILSMAYMQPRVAENSLLRKVNKKKRIVQDTGTGGAYPCSTDRMIWAVAAWEVYKATGDKDWLQQAYTIIKNSIDDDLHVIYDKETGLVKGESSFLDWREQTYPRWMQPADIFESECLGTNAVHYKANDVLSQMALILDHKSVAKKHAAIASGIKRAINKYLWMPDKGYYAQYLYGRNYKIISPRSESLGEALCIVWNIADKTQQQSIIEHTPQTDFGTTCIYPQIPGIPPYHNNAVWPFVQTYWAWAAAKTNNEKAVLQSIADIYRPAAMFATNKENLVAENGDFAGTQINSSNMLWSLSGNISLVHKVLFGICFNDDGLSFQPFVPEALKGKRSLTNFKYRNAILDITMEGYGDKISTILLDGNRISRAFIPSTIVGTHQLFIKLLDNHSGNNPITIQPVYFAPATPDVFLEEGRLTWQPVKGAKNYRILKNGVKIASTNGNTYKTVKGLPATYQVIAVDENNVFSFASEPLLIAADQYVSIYQADSFSKKAGYDYKGFIGDGFVEISDTANRDLEMPLYVRSTGWYSVDIRYANGNGPTNTDNKCAIRTLKADGIQKGSFVFPQRGTNEWSNWGYSNSIRVYLEKGKHRLSLSFEPFDDNMNGAINQAMINLVRIIKIEK